MSEKPEPNPISEQSTFDQAGLCSAGSFGRYRLLQRLGEGGMGDVWVAEQMEPVHRQVALKVIKAGVDSAEVVARFEAERQALALMDHPAIATVFDGGTTQHGRHGCMVGWRMLVPLSRIYALQGNAFSA